MKKKAVSGIMLTLLLIGILVLAFNIQLGKTELPVKIGVIGQLDWWIYPIGIKEGAILAAEEINVSGGILGRPIELFFGDTQGDPMIAISEMERLITVEGVDFVVGGFKDICTYTMREVAMDHHIIFIITGASMRAASDFLVDCGDGTCGACVRCDYDRYKYLFRATPTNGSTLAASFFAFNRFVLEDKLLPIYGEYLWAGAPNKQVKVAVIIEYLEWTNNLHDHLTDPDLYALPDHLGPYANVTYSARVDFQSADYSHELQAIKDSGARLVIHAFTEVGGITFVNDWSRMEVEAVPVGINVLSQLNIVRELSGEYCEYETFLDCSGTRTPITALSTPFWDAYVTRWGHDPIYPAFGTYDAVYALKEAVERAGTTDSDAVVAELEQTDRIGTVGNFKFTEYHDGFCNEVGPTWTQGYSRPFVVQWQAGKKEVIWPADQSYSKEFLLPSSMPNLRAVTDVKPYKTVVGQGYSVPINVTVENQGDFTDPFNVTIYANTTLIDQIQITLTSGNSTTITFTWNTTGVAKGSYNISATADNILVDGVVTVAIPGDLDANGWVNIYDVAVVAVSFGSYPGHPKWFPNGDINNDGWINILDVAFVASHFGEYDP